MNLFTQDIIDTARLVRDSRAFLGEGELMRAWKEILGWDEARERRVAEAERDVWDDGRDRRAGALDRPTRKELNMKYGSYRKLPASVSPTFSLAFWKLAHLVSSRRSM